MNKRRSSFFEITVILLILGIGSVMIYLTISHNNDSKGAFNPNNHFLWNMQNQKIGRITNVTGDTITVSIYPGRNGGTNNSTEDQSNTTLSITLNDSIKIYTSNGRNKPEVEANKDALITDRIVRIQYDTDNTTVQKIIVMIEPSSTSN